MENSLPCRYCFRKFGVYPEKSAADFGAKGQRDARNTLGKITSLRLAFLKGKGGANANV